MGIDGPTVKAVDDRILVLTMGSPRIAASFLELMDQRCPDLLLDTASSSSRFTVLPATWSLSMVDRAGVWSR